MVRARFTGYNQYHDGERLEQGDVVELTEEQYDQWDYQFELLDDGPEDETDTPEEPEEGEDESDDTQGGETEESEEEPADESEGGVGDPADLPTVSELEDRLAAGEYDDRLDELEIAERSRDSPRDTALEAIEARKEEV